MSRDSPLTGNSKTLTNFVSLENTHRLFFVSSFIYGVNYPHLSPMTALPTHACRGPGAGAGPAGVICSRIRGLLRVPGVHYLETTGKRDLEEGDASTLWLRSGRLNCVIWTWSSSRATAAALYTLVWKKLSILCCHYVVSTESSTCKYATFISMNNSYSCLLSFYRPPYLTADREGPRYREKR